VACADALAEVVARLHEGAIVAMKGLGGFHLCVDAANDAAVRRLRRQKCREEKPFAIMVRDVARAEAFAELDEADRLLLESFERPIVLVRKRSKSPLSGALAPGMATLGIMLPYTPLQHLLLQEDFHALVMTSANRTDEPICIGNREAIARLNGIADLFLTHNRDILVRCDDSVAMTLDGEPYLLRRARGYVPRPLILARQLPPVLALGAHQKVTVCILKQDRAFLSQHIGDMETPQARDFFHETIRLMKKITECDPEIVAHDLHPGYYSTQVAGSLGGSRVIGVQHHHAHIVSCMAEHGLTGRVIGIAMDGTGWGDDGKVWGGEFLVADWLGYERAGHFRYFMLPGGEQAVRHPWRSAAGLLREAYGNEWPEVAARIGIVSDRTATGMIHKSMEQGINAPLTSSLGRLFDAVAALLGLRHQVSFEGQAAMELEAAATEASGQGVLLPYIISDDSGALLLDVAPAIREVCRLRLAGAAREAIAAGFHTTLCHAFAGMAERIRERTGISNVVLSGGCFQNKRLTTGCCAALRNRGFTVFIHRRVPPGDGGISLGQAVVAASRAREKGGLLISYAERESDDAP